MKTREEKIKYLNELSQGKRSLTEILPPISLNLVAKDQDGKVFEDIVSGKLFDKAQLERMIYPKGSSIYVSLEELITDSIRFEFANENIPRVTAVRDRETLEGLISLGEAPDNKIKQ